MGLAVLHRAILTWFLFAIFLVFVTLKCDDEPEWDWFIVFTPMWIFDFKLFVYITFRIISHCRNGHDPQFVTMYRKCWYLFCVFLKVAFQILLSVRLQYYNQISWFYIMIPLWILLDIDTLVISTMQMAILAYQSLSKRADNFKHLILDMIRQKLDPK